ncbi:hypothetical protein PAPYR_10242 [Paratrimastix pyriformis]|uniref:Uncharacterized protein n=1 Tax=Paratrimastix pyriformis TaxID=342808 RepID=A0ABQ8U6G5_9EUKA|nr:hypothetical protein PAPYR_10242 [Paratrimastix pyriformis]
MEGDRADADPVEQFRQVVRSLRFEPPWTEILLSYNAGDLQLLSDLYPSAPQLVNYFDMHGFSLRSPRLAHCVHNLFHPAPMAAPVPAPMAAPVPAPMAAPVPAPMAAPVPAPMAAPVPAPMAAPVPAPMAAPVPAPMAAPVPAPMAAPVPAPMAAPVAPPVEFYIRTFGELVSFSAPEGTRVGQLRAQLGNHVVWHQHPQTGEYYKARDDALLRPGEIYLERVPADLYTFVVPHSRVPSSLFVGGGPGCRFSLRAAFSKAARGAHFCGSITHETSDHYVIQVAIPEGHPEMLEQFRVLFRGVAKCDLPPHSSSETTLDPPLGFEMVAGFRTSPVRGDTAGASWTGCPIPRGNTNFHRSPTFLIKVRHLPKNRTLPQCTGINWKSFELRGKGITLGKSNVAQPEASHEAALTREEWSPPVLHVDKRQVLPPDPVFPFIRRQQLFQRQRKLLLRIAINNVEFASTQKLHYFIAVQLDVGQDDPLRLRTEVSKHRASDKPCFSQRVFDFDLPSDYLQHNPTLHFDAASVTKREDAPSSKAVAKLQGTASFALGQCAGQLRDRVPVATRITFVAPSFRAAPASSEPAVGTMNVEITVIEAAAGSPMRHQQAAIALGGTTTTLLSPQDPAAPLPSATVDFHILWVESLTRPAAAAPQGAPRLPKPPYFVVVRATDAVGEAAWTALSQSDPKIMLMVSHLTLASNIGSSFQLLVVAREGNQEQHRASTLSNPPLTRDLFVQRLAPANPAVNSPFHPEAILRVTLAVSELVPGKTHYIRAVDQAQGLALAFTARRDPSSTEEMSALGERSFRMEINIRTGPTQPLPPLIVSRLVPDARAYWAALQASADTHQYSPDRPDPSVDHAHHMPTMPTMPPMST